MQKWRNENGLIIKECKSEGVREFLSANVTVTDQPSKLIHDLKLTSDLSLFRLSKKNLIYILFKLYKI